MFVAADIQRSDHDDLESIDCARPKDFSYHCTIKALQLLKLRICVSCMQE